jgi:hypothetical protein
MGYYEVVDPPYYKSHTIALMGLELPYSNFARMLDIHPYDDLLFYM